MQTNRSNVGALVGGADHDRLGLTGSGRSGLSYCGLGLSMALHCDRELAQYFLWQCSQAANGAAAFAIPGSIIGGVGLVLLFQNMTHHWESMSYFWTLIVMFVGTGIYTMGWYSGDENQKHSGARVIGLA